ncbi:Uncharacterized protein SCF082_LOCUS38021 [Durusdinium trenchii]|uniref:Uncharacterized protein n=1 Tax=Durusdinium trenchii TaxID=1381693 RepID=A0ABP0PY01_9DINO
MMSLLCSDSVSAKIQHGRTKEVIASLSIAFGTLTSLTISSLRQRQKEIRHHGCSTGQCLNKEARDGSLDASKAFEGLYFGVDQSEGRFLAEKPADSLRLRMVFTLMTGSFCGLTALCADLNDLFRGSFNINESASQLKVVEKVIRYENCQLLQKVQAFQDQRGQKHAMTFDSS